MCAKQIFYWLAHVQGIKGMKGDPGAKGVQGFKGQKGMQVGITDVKCSVLKDRYNYSLFNSCKMLVV